MSPLTRSRSLLFSRTKSCYFFWSGSRNKTSEQECFLILLIKDFFVYLRAKYAKAVARTLSSMLAAKAEWRDKVLRKGSTLKSSWKSSLRDLLSSWSTVHFSFIIASSKGFLLWILKDKVWRILCSRASTSSLLNLPCPASLSSCSIIMGTTSSNLELIKIETSPIKWRSDLRRFVPDPWSLKKYRSIILTAKNKVYMLLTFSTLKTYIIQSTIFSLWSAEMSWPSSIVHVDWWSRGRILSIFYSFRNGRIVFSMITCSRGLYFSLSWEFLFTGVNFPDLCCLQFDIAIWLRSSLAYL